MFQSRECHKGNITTDTKMTRYEVLHKIIEIVNEHKASGFPETTENSRLAEDLGLDSLDIVETCSDVKRRLDIEFNNKDWHNVKFSTGSVKDIVDLACKKLNIPVSAVNNTKQLTERKFRIKQPSGRFDVHIPNCSVNLDDCRVYQMLYPLQKNIKIQNLPFTNGYGNTVQQNRIEVEIPDIETITWSNIYRICNECKKNSK